MDEQTTQSSAASASNTDMYANKGPMMWGKMKMFFLVRVLITVIILAIVFWSGVAVGSIGSRRFAYPMMGGYGSYQGGNMMYRNIPGAAPQTGSQAGGSNLGWPNEGSQAPVPLNQ